MLLAVPGHGGDLQARAVFEAGGEQRHDREQPEQAGRRAGDCLIRPLALGLDAEGVAHLAEGDLPLPTLDEPADDLQGVLAARGPGPHRCRAEPEDQTEGRDRAVGPSGSAPPAARHAARRRCRSRFPRSARPLLTSRARSRAATACPRRPAPWTSSAGGLPWSVAGRSPRGCAAALARRGRHRGAAG